MKFHGYPCIVTTPEVWAVLRARHCSDMTVGSTYSNPSGNDGMSSTPTMETTYALNGADSPLIGARTTWEKDPEADWKRVNEKHEYFLFLAKKEAD